MGRCGKSFISACRKTKIKLRLKTSIFVYNLYLKLLLPKIARRRPVRVMFYVNNLSMWKSDKLLTLLKSDSRFEPFIVSYLYSNDSDLSRRNSDKVLSEHFDALGISFCSGYDYVRHRHFPVSSFKPDILFYPQPYRNFLSEIPSGVLLAYIPYGFSIEKSGNFDNTLYQNICWKYFIALRAHKEHKIRSNYNHGVNVVVSGDPLADYFMDGHTPSDDNWPIKDPAIKRIIWAPHHSILPDDVLDYSTFLEIAESMLELARKYKDKVQFVFKPHPLLKEKLYHLGSWGVEKTDRYYQSWNSLPNCRFADGNYVDLFMTSDAMIHDCSAFTAEYLYVNKPVLYLTKKQKMESFNEFACECFNVHYHGSTIADIKSFIDDVVNGIDPLLDQRTRLIKEQLLPSGDTTVAGTIYKELCTLFE